MEDFLQGEDNPGGSPRWPHSECDLSSQDNKIYSAPFDRTSIKASMQGHWAFKGLRGQHRAMKVRIFLASTRDLWMLFVLEQDCCEHPTACDWSSKAESIKTAELS